MIDQTKSMLQKSEENLYPCKVAGVVKGTIYLNNAGSARVLAAGIALGIATQTMPM